jgi:hypothetical protein
MSHGYLIELSHLELGHPKNKFSLQEVEYVYGQKIAEQPTRQPKDWSLPSIFRRLLVYDQLPDTDRQSVIDEILGVLRLSNPAFAKALTAEFQFFSSQHQNLSKWEKIKQDNLQYITSEFRRRNSENPYHTDLPQTIKSWEELPLPERAYKNKPWQFDMLYRDAQFLASKIEEYITTLKNNSYVNKQDRDIFRIKTNSLLAADKIVFALNSGENRGDFLDEAINIVDLKLNLDGLAIAGESLQYLEESLHKLSWDKSQDPENITQIQGLLQLTEDLQNLLRQRVSAIERRLMMFMRLEKDHY